MAGRNSTGPLSSRAPKKADTQPADVDRAGRQVFYDEAREYYGSVTTEAIKAFQHEVGICIDCMLQDDAHGQTIVFVRENGDLVPKTISADTIDLNNLQQYEMILFDGGNSAGDTWKHTFFPKQLQDHFVVENRFIARNGWHAIWKLVLMAGRAIRLRLKVSESFTVTLWLMARMAAANCTSMQLMKVWSLIFGRHAMSRLITILVLIRF